MKIHPTALVSSKAKLADDVEIGAHVVIGDEVSLGPGCVVKAKAVIEGRTRIGEGSSIGYGAVLGAPPQDLAYKDSAKSSLRIGKRNTFGDFVTVHRGTKDGSMTFIGDDCHLMAGSHLGHNGCVGNNVTIADNCLIGGYVEIGNGTTLESASVFHQFVRIGPLVLARGCTWYAKDIPPYVLTFGENLLSGINSIGLSKAGWTAEACLEIKRAFRLVYGSKLNVSQALQKARETEWSPAASAFFDFIAVSKRGVCSAKRRGKLTSLKTW